MIKSEYKLVLLSENKFETKCTSGSREFTKSKIICWGEGIVQIYSIGKVYKKVHQLDISNISINFLFPHLKNGLYFAGDYIGNFFICNRKTGEIVPFIMSEEFSEILYVKKLDGIFYCLLHFNDENYVLNIIKVDLENENISTLHEIKLPFLENTKKILIDSKKERIVVYSCDFPKSSVIIIKKNKNWEEKAPKIVRKFEINITKEQNCIKNLIILTDPFYFVVCFLNSEVVIYKKNNDLDKLDIFKKLETENIVNISSFHYMKKDYLLYEVLGKYLEVIELLTCKKMGVFPFKQKINESRKWVYGILRKKFNQLFLVYPKCGENGFIRICKMNLEKNTQPMFLLDSIFSPVVSPVKDNEKGGKSLEKLEIIEEFKKMNEKLEVEVEEKEREIMEVRKELILKEDSFSEEIEEKDKEIVKLRNLIENLKEKNNEETNKSILEKKFEELMKVKIEKMEMEKMLEIKNLEKKYSRIMIQQKASPSNEKEINQLKDEINGLKVDLSSEKYERRKLFSELNNLKRIRNTEEDLRSEVQRLQKEGIERKKLFKSVIKYAPRDSRSHVWNSMLMKIENFLEGENKKEKLFLNQKKKKLKLKKVLEEKEQKRIEKEFESDSDDEINEIEEKKDTVSLTPHEVVMNKLEKSKKAIKALSMYDINEVSSYIRPKKIVFDVIKQVLILLKKGNEKSLQNWNQCKVHLRTRYYYYLIIKFKCYRKTDISGIKKLITKKNFKLAQRNSKGIRAQYEFLEAVLNVVKSLRKKKK